MQVAPLRQPLWWIPLEFLSVEGIGNLSPAEMLPLDWLRTELRDERFVMI